MVFIGMVTKIRNYKGSKRPEGIDSGLRKMLGSNERKKITSRSSGGQVSTVRSEEQEEEEEEEEEEEVFSSPARGNSMLSCRSKASGWQMGNHSSSISKVFRASNAKDCRACRGRTSAKASWTCEGEDQGIWVQSRTLKLFASVARLVSKDEIARNPKAKAALDKEWENLRTKGVWDERRVRECRELVAEAHREGKTIHLGRIFEACYEKGSELAESDPRRKFKGRTVFQGNNVRDENSHHALFNELGSSPASMEAAKLLDAFGSQPGFSKQQADAIQAYIQALFTGVPTWLSLPRNRWPRDWEKKCWQPMVPMLLALYGHPDSGGIWENHLSGRVVKQGWKQILPDIWHSIFQHQEVSCLLVVYVDDFKVAGPSANMEKAWASIKAAVSIGDPEPYDRYFGCTHREFENIRLPSSAHPFAFAFGAKKSAAAQHRTQDWWGHDENNQAWIRHHVQPRKRLYQPGDEGGGSTCQNSSRITFFDKKVTLKGCPSITDGNN